jgi:hypothetical protein
LRFASRQDGRTWQFAVAFTVALLFAVVTRMHNVERFQHQSLASVADVCSVNSKRGTKQAPIG